MDATIFGFSTPQEFNDVKKLPKFRLENGAELKFQGHHVIPQAQFKNAQSFFSALKEKGLWDTHSFANNGIALPNKDTVGLGVAVHSGHHPAYSSFIEDITSSFEDAYKDMDFGGKTEEEWLEGSAKKIRGIVSHLRYELANPNSDYHLKIDERKRGQIYFSESS